MRALPLALASVCRYGWATRPIVWRAAEEVDALPVGAHITLTGRSVAFGVSSLSFGKDHPQISPGHFLPGKDAGRKRGLSRRDCDHTPNSQRECCGCSGNLYFGLI